MDNFAYVTAINESPRLTPRRKVPSEQVTISVQRPILYAQDFSPALKNASCCTSDQMLELSASGEGAVSASPFAQLTSLCKRHFRPSLSPSEATSQGRNSLLSFLQSIFPILHWLPNYSVRDNFFSDLVTGITILALHIPQGLAYGRLAGVEPIFGLYVSLFPVLVYSFMGTSRQISVGTFAVVSIACNDVLNNFKLQFDSNSSNGTAGILESDFLQFGDEKLKPIEVLTSLALLVGLIQFVLGSLRLGILAILLSDPVISSFVCASSFHVFTSQVFGLLGIDSNAKGNERIPFVLIRNWYRLLSRLPQANLVTIGLSAGTLVVLLLCKNVLEPFLIRRYKLRNLALPIDILCIILLTLLSYLYDLNGQYQVAIIPKISTGFRNIPTVPRLDLMPQLLTSALLLSFVIYVVTYSLAKMFAAKHGYEVNANQELLALGTANIISAFLLCYPCSGSLSRSAVQDKLGGKSQMASLISSALVIIFLLYLSTYLETLPKCALSSIIVVALFSTMAKFSELLYYWRLSRLDGFLWACSFTAVILFGVDRGLLYGLTLSFVILMVRLTVPVFNLKFKIPDSEIFLSRATKHDADLPIGAQNITATPGVIVFEFHGPLIFLNVETFKKRFNEFILQPIKAQRMEAPAHLMEVYSLKAATTSSGTAAISSVATSDNNNNTKVNDIVHRVLSEQIHSVVFDCGRVSYLDSKGVEVLLEMAAELAKLGSIQLLLATVSEEVLQTLIKGNFFLANVPTQNCFVSVHDAVAAASYNAKDSFAAVNFR